MSTTDGGMTLDPDSRGATPGAAGGALPRFENPIVPNATIAGRALVAVIAIMTFLAALATGAVMMVRAAAGDWQAEVAREVTIQVRPVASRDIEADVVRAAEIARGLAGIEEVRALSRSESARLLEPWLGAALVLDDLPVPRLIVVRIAPDAAPEFALLRKQLAAQVPSASLDDHRNFVERMRSMANAMVLAGIVVLALVLVATFLSVAFATRGAMAENRAVIEVLHFIGARNDFIAKHFQHRFLMLGLQGGALGGGCALLLFALTELAVRWLPGSAAVDQLTALFGTFSVGLLGYVAVIVQVLMIAAVTAIASRITVSQTLDAIQ